MAAERDLKIAPARDLSRLADAIHRQKFADEDTLAKKFLAEYRQAVPNPSSVEKQAEELVEAVRARQTDQPLLDAFLNEFGLSNEEGIALMCLAEALLRVPDQETADDLIADKILSGDWSDHIGQADSLFVNASTWALMLTGQVISLDQKLTVDPRGWFGGLVNRAGTPVIRNAMYAAMRILGSEFVLGRTIDEAVRRGKKEFGPNSVYSFDMLGEGARDQAAADRYFDAYAQAIGHVGSVNNGTDPSSNSSVSIKLSALHPRYEFSQWDRVADELTPRLLELCLKASTTGVAITIDAEEMDRLEISLRLFEKLARSPALKGWNGLGLAVQAYGKRALPVLQWLVVLAGETRRRFPVRLVKGAYWDTELKHAQELGLPDFPVFTRKSTTDISYLLCAKELLEHPNEIYAQFATHNAHTLAAVLSLAGSYRGFEFQRLHGMGELLYDEAAQSIQNLPKTRIYAPVGGHEDLLAYLVRRLLENGANSSFVNRFMDLEIPAAQIVKDPAALLSSRPTLRHDKIRQPKDLFNNERVNSNGLDLTSSVSTNSFLQEVKDLGSTRWLARAIVDGDEQIGIAHQISNPANKRDEVGTVEWTSDRAIEAAFDSAHTFHSQWDNRGGNERADILEAAARLIEERRNTYAALLVREAGKCYPDVVSEIREAVDFCRYYAQEARRHFETPTKLVGPTGESNELSLHGRGVFVCISPWNFPLAIFLGQVAAALAAGNCVLAKPAEQTPLIAAEAARVLHEAGVPPEALHYLPGDGRVGAKIVADSRCAGVAFTGGTETAKFINRSMAAREGPIVPLIAETGGQNVMIVDSTALLEQVSDDVIQSAFISAGQRCSALRVLLLQDSIADKAIDLICGAMDQLRIGDPIDLHTDIGPIIDSKAKQNLDTHIANINPRSIRSHSAPQTSDDGEGIFVLPRLFEVASIRELEHEIFGPILHVIRYAPEDLPRHLEEIRGTGFGLTFGIHSRIEGQTSALFAQQPAGNTYVNRNMVGAVVGVQPFGGQGLSGTGPKAGGPHYLLRFAAEKTLTVNTMASGGNADLLRL